MASTIEVNFDDGSSGRWSMSEAKAVKVTAQLMRLLGDPDTIKV